MTLIDKLLGVVRPAADVRPASENGSAPPSDPVPALVERLLGRPASGSSKRVIAEAIRRCGVATVSKLAAAGVRIHVYDDPFDERSLGHFAEYRPMSKTLHLAPSRMSVLTVLHELGHAIDDLLEPDPDPKQPVLRSQKDPALQKLHADYVARTATMSAWERMTGSRFWSDQARSSVQEYYAEGFARYHDGDRSREGLRRADPGLFAYLHATRQATPT